MPSMVSAGGDDAGPGEANCSDYCDFAKRCIGDNAIAASLLSDVIAGLNASDSATCVSGCAVDTGGDGSENPVVSCIADGRQAAMCDGDSTQAGLAAAFGLLGECCGTRNGEPLCQSICTPLRANSLTSSMITFCD
jgi:hypothetical protein